MRTPTSRKTRQTGPIDTGPVGVDYGSETEDGEYQEPEASPTLDFDIGDEGRGRRQTRGGRAPAKSPLSKPSGIDLNKGLDLDKPTPPRRGGLGIEIGASPKGNLNIGVSAPLGIGPGLQARGGVSLDKKTGKPVGGYGGLGAGAGPISGSIDLGVDDSGCYRYVTASVGPFSHTWGENRCKEKEKPPEPPPPDDDGPTDGPSYNNDPDDPDNQKNWKAPTDLPPFEPAGPGEWECPVVRSTWFQYAYDFREYGILNGPTLTTWAFKQQILGWTKAPYNDNFRSPDPDPWYRYSSTLIGTFPMRAIRWRDYKPDDKIGAYIPDSGTTEYVYSILRGLPVPTRVFAVERIGYAADWYNNKVEGWECRRRPTSPSPSPSPSPGGEPIVKYNPPPIPNYPPKKKDKKMEDCCLITAAYLQRILEILGQPLGPEGEILSSSGNEFFPYQKERIKTPKNPEAPGIKVTEKWANYFELLTYLLDQQINLDVALDPQGYELATGEVMNPEYQRPSEISLRDNKQPDKDKLGRLRSLTIGQQIYIPSALQEMRYLFDAVRRFEYLFPYGELADAQIAKQLLIPSAKKGENLKIFNMIHAYEIQMQYLNAIIGDPREMLYLKDVDPSKAGDQEFKFHALSLSHLVRELFKFQLDTNGDLDMVREAVIRDLRTNLATRITTVQIAEMVTALFEDTGMLEEQKWLELPLEGDPYAGHWKAGVGFQPSEKLDSKKEEDIEALARATLQNYTAKVKVSRRSPKEKTDMRDLLRGLADFVQRLFAVPTDSIDSLIENAKFKIQTDMALVRSQVTKAASAARSRTRKKGK